MKGKFFVPLQQRYGVKTVFYKCYGSVIHVMWLAEPFTSRTDRKWTKSKTLC